MTHDNPLRLLDVALHGYAAGLCIVPPMEDGSKRPDGVWKDYERVRPSLEQVTEWYATGHRSGVGSVTGKVSGDLEVLDYDEQGIYEQYCEAANLVGLGPLVEEIAAGYFERTPGGVHLLYRCEGVTGNHPLARRLKRPDEMQHPKDKVQVLIETRGEGGYIILAPSNGRVNRAGPYELVSGTFETIVTITPEERESLHDLAQTFDEMPRPAYREPRSAIANGQPDDNWELRPGDDFNVRASWPSILEPHGWRYAYSRGDEAYWRRPGKNFGHSATTNFRGSGLLYVFTTRTTAR